MLASSLKLLTRPMLISSNYRLIAAARPTMFVPSEGDQGVDEVPTPAHVRESGIIPEGFSVDFILDPDTVITALAKQGIADTDNLPPEVLDNIKAILNAPDNLRIVPTSVYEEKRMYAGSA